MCVIGVVLLLVCSVQLVGFVVVERSFMCFVCVSVQPANEEERALVNELKVSVYNNIAITQFQLKTYSTAIQACDYCLAISPTNVKALYRRAHCRLDNPQISTIEHEMALADLVAASKADPSNTAIARQIKELRMAAKKQNEIDKKTFTGLFERGAVYDKEVPSGEEEKKEDPDDKDFLVGGDADETAVGEGVGSSEKKTFAVSADGTRKFTKEDVIKNIKEHEVCVQYLKKNKRFKEAEEMVEKVRLMKLRLQQMTDTVDFMNPSAEMIGASSLICRCCFALLLLFFLSSHFVPLLGECTCPLPCDCASISLLVSLSLLRLFLSCRRGCQAKRH